MQYLFREGQRGLWLPAALLLLGGALTALAVQDARQTLAAHTTSRFDRHVERIGAEVQRRFNQPTFGLHGLAATYNSGAARDRASFRAWVNSRPGLPPAWTRIGPRSPLPAAQCSPC